MVHRTAKPPNVHSPRYSAVAVDKAIQSSIRAGHRISKREASLIHRLLKGRHGNPVHSGRVAIFASGNGQARMHFDGRKFTSAGKPLTFCGQVEGITVAHKLVAKYPVLARYRLTVEPVPFRV